MMLTVLLAASIVIVSNFEGGNIRKVDQSGPAHFIVHLPGDVDQDGRNRQANWYSFRVDGAKGQPLTIEIAGLAGEYNYKPNKGAVTADTPPYFSYDNKTWKPWTDFTYDGETPKLVLRITPESGRLWVAHVPPYTNEHLEALRKSIAGSKWFKEEVIGKTPEGRPLRLWHIAEGAPSKMRAGTRSLLSRPPRGWFSWISVGQRPMDTPSKHVWLMARQHSWESPTSWVCEGLVRFLLSNDAEAARIRRSVAFHILPMNDPDGVARGGVRFNKYGYDLNRNWDFFNAGKMPEIAAQHAAIAKWIKAGNPIDLFLTMHNTETAEYLEGAPAAGEGKFKDLGERFFRLLNEKTTFAPSRPLSWAERTTTEGKPGRMTVVQGLYRDFGFPTFLTEQRVSMHPKLGRRALTEDRLQFGRDLAGVLAEAVR